MVCAVSLRREPYGEKTRSGHFPEEQIIALRTLTINQSREVFCKRRFSASLIIYVLIVSPSPAVPPTFMPLPSRNTRSCAQIILDPF